MEITVNNLAKLHKEYIENCNDRYNVEKMQNTYSKDELILHDLLNHESFYSSSCEEEGKKRTLAYVSYIYPDTTAEDVQNVFSKYFDIVIEIYG